MVTSTDLLVDSGVVQGSVLGPTPYYNETADLSSHVKLALPHIYADDTHLLMRLNLDRHEIDRSV